MGNTLADHLRALPDDGLAALFALRPDLVVPVPADLSALAGRAQTRVSAARALDPLDRFTLEILDGLRLSRRDGTTSLEAVTSLATAGHAAVPAALVRAAVDRLRARFLVYGPESELHIAAGVDEACLPYPAGLGRPAAELDPVTASLCADPAGLRRAVLAAPAPARAVLDRLADGPPLGTVTRSVAADPTTPVGWLIAHHLLVPVDGASPGASSGPRLAEGTAGAIGDPPAGPDAGPATTRGGPGGTSGPGTTNGGTSGAPGTAGSGAPGGPGTTGGGSGGAHNAGGGGRRPEPLRGVELPREVGLLLRRDLGTLGALHPKAPVPRGQVRAVKSVDSAGAGQALEVLRQTEALLDALAAEPVPVLRSGGLGIRDLRRLARTAGMDEGQAAVLVEVAAGAGLVGEAEPDSTGEARFLPTLAYDSWRTHPLAYRWARLARAWLTLTRQPGLVGRRDDRDRPLSTLAPELERIGAPKVRIAVLCALADAATGTAVDADELLDLLAWRAPRQFPPSRSEQVEWALSEAALLGVTGLGALTGYGRLLLQELLADAAHDPDEDPLGLAASDTSAQAGSVAALDALLPDPVDHVLVQADLTVVLPGPASPTLAAELALIADAESANLFRLTPEGIRRALDAGHSASDLHALFAKRSRTPVPQALTYLVDDMARKHGGLRVGSANAYLCSDDEVLLVELFADRRLADLRLRRLAPTVLTSPYPSGRVLNTLREAGYAPVPEDSSGAAVLSRPRAKRAPARRSPVSLKSLVDSAPRVPGPRLAGIVEQLRRADAAARTARRAPVAVRTARIPGAQAHTQALAVLQQALRERQRVWVGYVDAHGGTASRLVRPVSMAAGYLRAEDDRTETLHTFALHRITAAVPEE